MMKSPSDNQSEDTMNATANIISATAANEEDSRAARVLEFDGAEGKWEIGGSQAAASRGRYVSHRLWETRFPSVRNPRRRLLRLRLLTRDERQIDRDPWMVLTEMNLIDYQLDDDDEISWFMGPDGRRTIPHYNQLVMPLEDADSGEILVFMTHTAAGRHAGYGLCVEWARQQRHRMLLPIVELGHKLCESSYAPQPYKPTFEIVGWEDAVTETANAASTAEVFVA